MQAAWDIALAPADEAAVIVTVAPVTGSRRRRAVPHPSAARRVERSYRRFTAACTSLEGDGELFEKVIAASVRDLRALLIPIDEDGAAGGRILSAGIPWFVAPFGRDSLLASYEALPVNPDLARDTLLFLARRQAQEDDPWRDAEPGKVLHELRFGELTRTGLVPHSPYYGTVDATPLFVMLAAAYWRWTADTETLTGLKPALDAALAWMDQHGDRDGDGFLEYERRSPGGLLNQGWKDSEDSVVHADGTLAEGSIALVEVQGYAYLAKQRIAEVYEALGEPDRAGELRRQAAALKHAFNEAFWMPEEGTLALALDGRKRQVASVTSNPGHCLYCDVVDPAHQSAVAERLMAPDMFSGWGIRTLSRESPAYNPMSYHNGSIWPHDNAIAAAGLKRAGHDQAAARVAGAVFEVAAGARDFRLPELYCGFDRGDEAAPVPYPVACNPQAWAAAAPFMLLQAMLGISARAAGGELDVHRPVLPAWLRHVRLRNMRVGSARVGLAFHRDERDAAGFSLIEQDGELQVTVTM